MAEQKPHGLKGVPRPPEVRARISEGKKRQWERIREALRHVEEHEREEAQSG